MMEFVDVLVERTPMEGSMRPIMPCILKDEEHRHLIGDGEERREGDVGRKAKVLSHWME